MKQRFSKRTRLVSALLTLAMVFTFLPISAFAEVQTYVPLYKFPDETFQKYLEQFDKDDDTFLSTAERNAVTEIDVHEKNITSLKGIELFPNLKKLVCYNNQLTSLDVSNNTKLVRLDCHGNDLSSLNVRQNVALTYLDCGTNQLTSLDVRQNAALTYLYCSQNNLTSLDVSQNPALGWLNCKGNQLTSLDLSQTAVVALGTSDNKITIEVEETSRTFDLSTLPGFDASKASGWVGGDVDGNTLKVNPGATQVTYTYDCGKGFSRDFTLNVKVVPDGTVTPPSGGSTGGGSTGGTVPPVTPPSGGGSTGGSSGGGDSGAGIAVLAIGGVAVAGLVGYGVYSYVSEQQLKALLPEGVAVPENRAQTALLLWNTAGRPEPAEAPAFADVADPDTAKAAQWCVEQGLMKRRLNGKFAPGSSIPAYQVLNAYRKLAGG